MMPDRLIVQVDADQYERLARPTQPLAGVAELIWNAVDAEADRVDVRIEQNQLSGVERVDVEDNGHGMTHSEVLRDFAKLGGSWKRHADSSRNARRSLHGKQGEGRFRAFSLGRQAVWTTVASEPSGGGVRTVVTMSLDKSECLVSDPELTTDPVGTTVAVTNPREHVSQLLHDDALTRLLTRFAVYLIKYPEVVITYNNHTLDTDSILQDSTTFNLAPDLGGGHGPIELHILEWKPVASIIRPTLILCDSNGAALHELQPESEWKDSGPFTAYINWDGFSTFIDELPLADLGHQALEPVVSAARDLIRNHFHQREEEERAELIQRWKNQDVYPYGDLPATPAEETQRRLFDAVALTAAAAVPAERKAARLSLRLLREALEDSPEALHRVLHDVLELTPEQLADFDLLLQRTTLASVIHTSKLVAGRLEFLDDLDSMLFDATKKERLLERKQLHRILADGRTWVFGEEFALVVSDRGLTKLLEQYASMLGQDVVIDRPLVDAEEKRAILDLVLSRVAQRADRRDNLVVELKRPDKKLGNEELTQISNYARAIARDARFNSPGVTWDFWLIGNDLDEFTQEAANQKGRPPGLYHDGENYRIWVKRWAEVLEENRKRLHFYRDNLEYKAADDESLEQTLAKYLPTESKAGAK